MQYTSSDRSKRDLTSSPCFYRHPLFGLSHLYIGRDCFRLGSDIEVTTTAGVVLGQLSGLITRGNAVDLELRVYVNGHAEHSLLLTDEYQL
jgi:hypothetical protein